MSDPWRYRCPNGHTSWTIRSTDRGFHNGEPAETRYRCETCGAEFNQLFDVKTGRTEGGTA